MIIVLIWRCDREKRCSELAKTVKIVEFKGQYRITLPKVLVQIKNWKSGMKLGVTELPDGRIALEVIEEKDEKTEKKR